MMWIDNKYIGLVSSRLQMFKRKNNGYNFRCPFCGDSTRSKTKSRGWIYQESGSYKYHCFNCNNHSSFKKFLQNIDQNLYTQYKMECLADTQTPEQKEHEEFVEKLKPKAYISNTFLKNLKKISQLPHDSNIKKFIVNRKIPNPYHAKLFACPNYMNFVNTLIPNKFSEDALKHDETRILIPFINKDNKVHAFQGRSLKSNSQVKYITIVIDDDIPVIYGLDTVNFNNPVNVFEGPIDAMFIPNSIATAGGDLVSSVRTLDKKNLVVVYDNEPRSHDTKKKLDKAIMNGYSVCIWPSNIEHKDVNDMVLAGLSAEFIEYIIKQNTYRDLAAKLALTKWSKV